MLRDAGLGSLPGTAAEVLHDGVRRVLCPDKIGAARWLEVVDTAHRVGLKTTSTIMFGHMDQPHHWAQHLVRLYAVCGICCTLLNIRYLLVSVYSIQSFDVADPCMHACAW